MGDADILDHAAAQGAHIGVDGRQLAVALNAALPAQRPGIDFSRRTPFFEDAVKTLQESHSRPEQHHFDAVALQKRDGAAVDEVPVLRHLAGDAVIEHDLAVDHLVQRLIVHERQKDRGQAVLAEGAGRHILYSARIHLRPRAPSTDTTLSRGFPVRRRKSVTAEQAFSSMV